jgi:hypothetical protein
MSPTLLHRLSAASRGLALPLAPALLIGLLVTAFTWPTSHLEPRGVPVAVSGSPGFVDRTTQALDASGADSFDVTVAPDRASGVELLRHNDVDGVFEEGDQLLLASAGRPAVAQLLTSVQTRLTGETGSAPVVVTTVAAPSGDPRSAVFTAAALPTILGAIASGVLLSFFGGTRTRRLLGVVAGSALAGVVLTLVMDSWLGALSGGWWAEWALYSLAVAAVTAAIVGMHNVFGRVGMVGAAAVVLLLGNPLAGATSAPELLPDGWSALGQAMPPGALTSALRSVAFYGDHGASGHVAVLAAWALVGFVLLCAGPSVEAGPRVRQAA